MSKRGGRCLKAEKNRWKVDREVRVKKLSKNRVRKKRET